jgi:hypothetical protein
MKILVVGLQSKYILTKTAPKFRAYFAHGAKERLYDAQWSVA